jgi:hypothetical protein
MLVVSRGQCMVKTEVRHVCATGHLAFEATNGGRGAVEGRLVVYILCAAVAYE